MTKDIIERTKEADEDLKEAKKEIKLLRRLQYHQGNRLIDITDPTTFPKKI